MTELDDRRVPELSLSPPASVPALDARTAAARTVDLLKGLADRRPDEPSSELAEAALLAATDAFARASRLTGVPAERMLTDLKQLIRANFSAELLVTEHELLSEQLVARAIRAFFDQQLPPESAPHPTDLTLDP